jgi:hypothetical protein
MTTAKAHSLRRGLLLSRGFLILLLLPGFAVRAAWPER